MWLVVRCGSNAPDIKLGFTIPPGTTIKWSGIGDGNAGTDHPVTVSGPDVFHLTGGGVVDWIRLRGIVSAGLTGGTVQLQWAQQNASIQATTIDKNSYLQASKF